MQAGHAHKVQVGADTADGFHGGGADADDGMLVQAAAQHQYFDVRMLYQFDRNRRAMRNDRGGQVMRQLARQLYGGGAPIDKYHLPRLYHGGRCSADGYFGIG